MIVSQKLVFMEMYKITSQTLNLLTFYLNNLKLSRKLSWPLKTSKKINVKEAVTRGNKSEFKKKQKQEWVFNIHERLWTKISNAKEDATYAVANTF